MSIAMALKIFSDCCICFAILATGPVKLGVPLLLIALVCGGCSGIAAFFDQKGWKLSRMISAALPLFCFLFLRNGDSLILVLLPVLYTSFVILRGKLELEYYTYRRFFLYSLGLLGTAYLIVNVWSFLALVTNERQPDVTASVILRYGLVHFLCGIVLQRQLRLGVDYRSSSGRNQLILLLGAAMMIVVGFLLTEPLLRQSAAVMMKYLLTLLFAPVMLLVELASWMISLFEKKREPDPVVDSTANVSGEGAVPLPGGNEGLSVTEPLERVDYSGLMWGMLVLVFLAAAAVILYRSFHKGRDSADSGELTGQILTGVKRKKAASVSNRAKIRQYYRDFLRIEKGWGMKLRISDTSEDILRRIHPETDHISAEALRHIYLKARYDDRGFVSRSQVTHAKQALKGTRKKKSV